MPSFREPYPYGFGRAALAPPPPAYVDPIVLAPGVMELHPLPAGAAYLVFSLDGDFFAKFGTSSVVAALPMASTSDGSGSELNPAARRVPAGATHVALIASQAATGSLSVYL